jgi:hypothetical protein
MNFEYTTREGLDHASPFMDKHVYPNVETFRNSMMRRSLGHAADRP